MNPKCVKQPNSTDQYVLEWVYANLDLNGDSYLDQSELDIVRKAVPQIASQITLGSYSMNFDDFVALIW